MQLIIHVCVKLSHILSTLWGWAMAIALFVLDYFSGHGFIVLFVVASTLMDGAWGIALSIHLGKFTLSELARQTIAKLAVYGCAMFVFVGLDRMTGMVLTAAAVGTVIVLVEWWSSCGAMSVFFPDFLFLKLMRKALTGEIASKLQVDPEEVEEILKSEKYDINHRTTQNGDS